MYVRHTRIRPSLDNAAEVRSLVEERVRSNPTEARVLLAQNVLGELPTLTVTALYEDMAALEKDRDANAADPDFQSLQAKLGSMIRQPYESSVFEVIIRGDPGAQPTARYTIRAEFFPAPGKQAEVEALLEEFAKGQQADGRSSFRMARQVFSPSGSVIALGDGYETLAEYQNVARQRRDRSRELIAKVEAISRAPMSHELRETIVPFTS